MTFGLVSASYSLPEWQGVKMTFFAPWGRFPIHTGPTPPLTLKTMVDACIQNFFRVSTLYRVGGGRTARKFRQGCPEGTKK